MSSGKDRLDVHVVVTVTGDALSAIVDHTRRLTRRDENGGKRPDAADMAGEMITRFLDKYDFEKFVREESNYP